MNTKKKASIKIIFFIIVASLPLMFCSSGYITPYSLTATAAPFIETAVPTAYFVGPTNLPNSEATPLPTEDSAVISPMPSVDPNLTATEAPTPTETLEPIAADTPPMLYFAQSGDSVPALANRFGVNQFEIVSAEEIPENGYLSPGQMMMIPLRLAHTSPETQLIPDSEIVYSPSANDFDIRAYVNSIGGKLSTYKEYLGTSGDSTGPEVIENVAEVNSINPRILLALLQYRSNWVYGQPSTLSQTDYPLGNNNYREKGLFKQLSWAVNQLSVGYYDWREGKIPHLNFSDGNSVRLAPTLNAGTVAILYYFNQVLGYDEWLQAIDPNTGFLKFYTEMFGDPWGRAAQVEPLLPSNLSQPPLTLPFYKEQVWAYTSGPHGAWQSLGSLAAIDFAPGAEISGCVKSDNWVLASASGIIARMDVGVVVLDMDGDGDETTGWNLLYLHLDNTDHLSEGEWLDVGDFLGNPSCEGGNSTGTHIHFARKYNGEWITAGGAIPMNLGGWVVEAGNEPYEGFLNRGNERIKSCICGAFYTQIIREISDP